MSAHHHKHQIRYFQTLKGALGMLRDPQHTESVFDIEDGLFDTESYDLAVEFVRQQPGVQAMLDQRYLGPPADLDGLSRLPAGSLGKCYALHIKRNGFDPDYFRKMAVQSDKDYIFLRIRQTHDIWHVLTGLGVDPIGELALKAFELVQTRRPMAAVITAGGVFRYLLKDPAQFSTMLDAVASGYQLGALASPLLARKWEEHWERPLIEWREELAIDVNAISDYCCPTALADSQVLSGR